MKLYLLDKKTVVIQSQLVSETIISPFASLMKEKKTWLDHWILFHFELYHTKVKRKYQSRKRPKQFYINLPIQKSPKLFYLWYQGKKIPRDDDPFHSVLSLINNPSTFDKQTDCENGIIQLQSFHKTDPSLTKTPLDIWLFDPPSSEHLSKFNEFNLLLDNAKSMVN